MKIVLGVGAAGVGAIAASYLLTPQRGPSKLDPVIEAQNRAAAQGLLMRKKKDHPVTPEMQANAEGQESKSAPNFSLMGLDGKTYSLASLTGSKPLLIFFIEKECPCCLGAKEFFERLHLLYRAEVNSVGIINAQKDVAEKWRSSTKAVFPILLDPKLSAIKGFNAERGAYVTLVDRNGQILKQYAGYGADMLEELNERLAVLAGVKKRRLNTMGAPGHLTGGCVFPEPELSPTRATD